ncbi:MAG: hypothetical protein H6598_02155 [Flavobacteriales bacterium]|nr:hypothetical protein [Flavobacteriales bacterium]
MKNFLFILLSLSVTSIFSQNDSTDLHKIRLGGNVGPYFSLASYSLCIAPDFTLEKGKSIFAIGPILGRKIYDNPGIAPRTIKHTLMTHGVHFSYTIFPNPRNTTFNLYFQYELAYFYYDIDIDTTHEFGYSILYKYINQYLENTVGFGYRINFLKRFYFNQGVSVGGVLIREKSYYTQYNSEPNKYILPTLMARLGIGFRI